MYRAEIKGDNKSLRILCKNFKSRVKFIEGICYLEHPRFNSLNDITKISIFAIETLNNMLSILNFKSNEKVKAEIGSHITEFKKDGSKSTGVVIHMPVLKATASLLPPTIATIDKNGNVVKIVDPEVASENLEPYIECIAENNNVKQVFKYFNDKNEFNLYHNYYKIIEVIGGDLGGIKAIPKQLDSVSRNKFSDLTYTLNEDMGKNPRHHTEAVIKSKILPEMEVKRLMKDIIEEWLSYKCK